MHNFVEFNFTLYFYLSSRLFHFARQFIQFKCDSERRVVIFSGKMNRFEIVSTKLNVRFANRSESNIDVQFREA